MSKLELRCAKCKGINVLIAKWVNPNTGEQLEDFGSFDEADTKWCIDCQENGLLEGVACGDEDCRAQSAADI